MFALLQLVDGALPQGKCLPAGEDPAVRLGRLQPQRLQLPLRFPLAGAQRLQLDCAPFLEGGQIVETAPGMLDGLLPDADFIFCRIEPLLELLDVLIVLGDLDPELLDTGLQHRELRADVLG